MLPVTSNDVNATQLKSYSRLCQILPLGQLKDLRKAIRYSLISRPHKGTTRNADLMAHTVYTIRININIQVPFSKFEANQASNNKRLCPHSRLYNNLCPEQQYKRLTEYANPPIYHVSAQ